MKTNKMKVNVSYGENYDEFISVESVADRIRFEICMKLYKTHDTVEMVENAISKESLKLINETF